MRYFLFIVLLLFISINTFSQNNLKIIKNKIDSLCKTQFFDTAQISIDIYNLSSQKNIYSRNNHLLMHPASNMKILTTAAALLYLGIDYEFTTSLRYSGEIKDSVLLGNIYVIGRCDPDFSLNNLDTLVQKILELGIKRIEGNIYGDVSMLDSLFWGNGWMWDDDPSTDFPYLTPLTINDNSISIKVFRNNNQKTDFQLSPNTKYVKVNNYSTSYDSLPTNIVMTRDIINRSNEFTISGNMNKKSGEVKNDFTIVKPAFYFLTLLKEKLISNRIEFTGIIDTQTVDENTILIAEHRRRFDEVIVNLNKTSDNLSAEMTLRALGQKYFGKPSSAEKGLRLIDSMIIHCKLKPSNYRIVDGSGVSHYNLVSTELLLGVLKYFYYNKSELYKILKESFPIAGYDGTLRNRMKNTLAEKNVYAKTGTLSGVSCLSGYLTAENGDEIAFSIMIQNHVRQTSRAIQYQNKICELLSNLK